MILDEARSILCDMLTEDDSGKEQLRPGILLRAGLAPKSSGSIAHPAPTDGFGNEPFILGIALPPRTARPAFTADEIEAIRVWRIDQEAK